MPDNSTWPPGRILLRKLIAVLLRRIPKMLVAVSFPVAFQRRNIALKRYTDDLVKSGLGFIKI